MEYKFKSVELNQIDVKDKSFCININSQSGPESDNLSKSIKSFGIINAPLLLEKKPGQYIIVCGHKRVAALISLNKKNIQARILPPESSLINCTLLSISDNIWQRDLSLIEKINCLNMLKRATENEKDFIYHASSLGLPTNRKMIKKFDKVRNFSRDILQAISSDFLSLEMALEIEKIEPDSRRTLLDLFSKLKLGLNLQRELFSYITDIMCRDELSASQILNNINAESILDDDTLSTPRKASSVRERIKKYRFPNIVNQEVKFQECLEKLELGIGIQLIPPKHFEGKLYDFRLSFQTIDQLKQIKTNLNKIIDSPHLKNILPK